MNLDDLNNLYITELRNISKTFGLDYKQPKNVLINNIKNRYYELRKYMSYVYINQLGHEGKDGRTFLVKNDNGDEYAVKIFKNTKNDKSLEKEAKLQMIAANAGISPKIIEYDKNGKFIVMEKLDYTLYDIFRKQNGTLTVSQQYSLLNLFENLDKCGVFHADPNPLNFMLKGKKWYIIDFGFAKLIDKNCIKKYGDNPNVRYMALGLVLQLKKIYNNCVLEIIEGFSDKLLRK